MTSKPTLVLSMIVKDEAQVVERALRSALPHIDAWAVVDTGSVDLTKELVRDVMGSLPGRLIQVPWSGFAAARNAALGLASCYGTHGLFLDADDTLEVPDLLAPPPDLKADAYDVEVAHNDVVHRRPHIVRLSGKALWRGVIHEYLDVPDSFVRAAAPYRIRVEGGGARSRDPLKYLHDADLIAKALVTETDQGLRNRYCFYLAQSYRDAGHAGAAIYWYTVAVEAGGWFEERYVAALSLGRLTGKREWFVRAAEINPHRAEAWRALGIDNVADTCILDPSWLFAETAAYRSPSPP